MQLHHKDRCRLYKIMVHVKKKFVFSVFFFIFAPSKHDLSMKTHLIFRQYTWLLTTIFRAGKISLDEINKRWIATEMSEGVEIPRSTFNHHRNAIEEMFGIFIDCDRKDGYKYYIGNPEDLRTANIQRWLVNSLSVSTLLADSRDLKGQILLEDIPSGQTFLEPILHAIRNKIQIKVTYQRFGKDETTTKVMNPYCVKLYHQRWYLVVYVPASSHQELTTYALDRIIDLEPLTDSHYTIPADFDAETFFSNYFGIYVEESKPVQRIVIRAYGLQPDYFRTLPLHSSQKELQTVSDTDEPYTDFEYHMAVTFDLIGELFSKNSYIEILEPASLRQEMKEKLMKTMERYNKK